MNEELFTIKQASQQIDTPVWVLRRLCRKGLIPYVRRNRAGYQVLTPEQVGFARMILALEGAGMSRKNLKRFVMLSRGGDETLVERKAMLETQKRNFWQELEDVQHGIDVIERQIELIDEKMRN